MCAAAQHHHMFELRKMGKEGSGWQNGEKLESHAGVCVCVCVFMCECVCMLVSSCPQCRVICLAHLLESLLGV